MFKHSLSMDGKILKRVTCRNSKINIWFYTTDVRGECGFFTPFLVGAAMY